MNDARMPANLGHAGLDLRRHRDECLLHVGAVLCRCLKERDTYRLCVRFGVVHVHHLLRSEVALVTHQHLVHFFVRISGMDVVREPHFYVAKYVLMNTLSLSLSLSLPHTHTHTHSH